MSSHARKFLATTDKIVITPNPLGNCQAFGFHFAFQLAAGATTLAPGGFGALFSQQPNVFALAYVGNANTAFSGTKPASGNYLVLQFTDGFGHYQQWNLQLDPFAGMAGDGLWHFLSAEWNMVSNSFTGNAILSIDGTTYNAGQLVQTFSGSLNTHNLATSSAALAFGTNDSGWPALVGLSIANRALWVIPTGFGLNGTERVFRYAGTHNDIANFAAGYDAQVIATGPDQIDVWLDATSPELGVKGALTSTITGMSTVTGPPLFPPYFVTPLLSHGGTGHTPGSATLTLTSTLNSLPSSPVVFTATSPWGSGTITLTGPAATSGSTTLAIPALVPATTYEVEVTDPGGVVPVSVGLTVVDPPTATVNLAEMMPTGNLVLLWLVDRSGNPTNVTGCDLTGATITKNGVATSLTGVSAAYTGETSYVWFNVGEGQSVQIVDDADAGCVLANGTWHQTTQATALLQNYRHSWYYVPPYGQGSLSYSATAGATATITFPTIPGRQYILSRNSPDVYVNSAQTVGGTATTGAKYLGSDGATVTLNQGVVGRFDRTNELYRWSDLWTFTATGSSYTVVITNAAGAGTLYVDALRLEMVPVPFMASGDMVSVTLPDSAITTVAGTTGILTLPLTLQTDETWYSFDPTQPRKMGIGFNIETEESNQPNHTLANRAKGSGGWTGTNGSSQLTTSGPSGSASTLAVIGDIGNFLDSNTPQQSGNGNDLWGFPGAPLSGPFTLEFTVPAGGNPTVTLAGQDAQAVSIPGGSNYGPGGAASGDGGPSVGGQRPVITFGQEPAYGPWPVYSQSLQLQCWNNGNPSLDVIQNLKILAPGVPANWPHTTDPSTYNRLAGQFPGGFLRFLDFLQINFTGSNFRNWSDQHSPSDLSYGGFSLNFSGRITAIAPLSGAGLALAQVVGGPNAWVQVTLDSAVQFAPWHGINWNNLTSYSGFALTNGGGVATFFGGYPCWPVGDGVTLIVQVNASASPSGLSTITAPIVLNGSENLQVTGGDHAGPTAVAAQVCSEVGMGLHYQTPCGATDDYANQAGACVAANLTPGLKVIVEPTNEHWNFGFPQFFQCQAEQRYELNRWNTSGRAQGAPLETADGWYAWRGGQIHAQFEAGFTGIPEVRVTGFGTGATARAVISGGQVIGITLLTPGSGYDQVPTVQILGAAGSGATATATISGGQVTGFVVTNGGSSYVPTGRVRTDIIRMFGSFSNGVNVTVNMAQTCVQFNTQMDGICVDGYQSNGGGLYNAVSGTIGGIYDSLSQDDLVDLEGLHALRVSRYGSSTAHVNAAVAAGVNPPPGLYAYEAGWDFTCPYGSWIAERATLPVRSRRHWLVELARLQQLELVYGFKAVNQFFLAGASGVAAGANWGLFLGDDNTIGTGSPGENPQPANLRTLASQSFGAQRFYASGTSPPPALTSRATLILTASAAEVLAAPVTAAGSLIFTVSATVRVPLKPIAVTTLILGVSASEVAGLLASATATLVLLASPTAGILFRPTASSTFILVASAAGGFGVPVDAAASLIFSATTGAVVVPTPTPTPMPSPIMPTDFAGTPVARIYNLDTGKFVDLAKLVGLRYSRVEQVYTLALRLGEAYPVGRYAVLYEAPTGGFVGVYLAIFEVVPGGDPAGPVISSLTRVASTGDLVLGHLASGILTVGTKPAIS